MPFQRARQGQILNPFPEWDKTDVPNDLPANVSPVFYELKKFIASEYRHNNQNVKNGIYAAAYLIYSEHKKNSIENFRKNGASAEADHIKTLFKTYINTNSFRDICKAAEIVNYETVDGVTRNAINEAIKDNRSTWRDILINLLATFIAAAFVFLLPILASFNNTTAIETLNSFGRYLVCNFQPSNGPNKDLNKRSCASDKIGFQEKQE